MENNEEILELKTPRLDPVEKLYVRAYLSKLSHSYAHSQVVPEIKHPKEDNPYSRRTNIQFHIQSALQERTEALELKPEIIIEKMYKEAIREDRTSSHSARIAALTVLGKHLGIFTDKKETENHTFNIIHYAPSGSKIQVTQGDIDQIEIKEEVELSSLDLEDMVEIIEYN